LAEKGELGKARLEGLRVEKERRDQAEAKRQGGAMEADEERAAKRVRRS